MMGTGIHRGYVHGERRKGWPKQQVRISEKVPFPKV